MNGSPTPILSVVEEGGDGCSGTVVFEKTIEAKDNEDVFVDVDMSVAEVKISIISASNGTTLSDDVLFLARLLDPPKASVSSDRWGRLNVGKLQCPLHLRPGRYLFVAVSPIEGVSEPQVFNVTSERLSDIQLWIQTRVPRTLRFVDKSGERLKSATMTVFLPCIPMLEAFYVVTNANGEATTSLLNAGEYSVSFSSPAGQSSDCVMRISDQTDEVIVSCQR